MLSKYHQPLTHLDQKFDAHGHVLRFPGNTLLCHVPLFTPLSDALTAVRDRIGAATHADALAMLPVVVLGLEPSSVFSEGLAALPASGRAAVSGLSFIFVRSIGLL